MRERRRARLLPALIALLALTGCVGIPTSGAVTTVDVPTEQDAGDLEFLPFGPSPGATQEEIVRGFIDAFNSSADDYRVARDYLSSGFESEWEPQANVIVRSAGSSDPLTSLDGDSLRYSVSASASVDPTGAFRQSDTPESVALTFDLVTESGEWRIAEAPPGIVLSDALFHRIYSQHSLYFLGATSDRLVPDVRWFPGGTAAVRIVSEVVAGPPEWLQGAVRTAFPDGTRVQGVTSQTGGTLDVDLSNEALATSQRDRQLMQAQLDASLGSIATLRRILLSASGAPIETDDTGGAAPDVERAVDDRPVALAGGAFGYLVAGEITPIGQLSGKVVAAGATSATVSADADAAALLSPAGVSIARTGSAPQLTVDGRAGLVPPSLDPYGFVWSTTVSGAGSISVYDFDGAVREVATGLPEGAEVVSLDVSRDGARIAMLLATPVGQRLVAMAVIRDPNDRQVPLRLGEPVLDVSSTGGRPRDATWIDDVSVATLADSATPDEGSVAQSFVLGGERVGLGILPASRSIVGGSTRSTLRIVGQDDVVQVRRGSVWVATDSVVSFLATRL